MEKDMEFTAISKKEWNHIADTEMSPADIARYFYEQIRIRKFSEILARFAEGQDIKTLLTDRLCEFDPDAKRDSVRKKVSNWLNGKNEPHRDELIKICFALVLNETEAQSFMRYSFDGGFHLRNPKELAFLYCLRSAKSYPDALRFVNSLKPLEKTIENEPTNSENGSELVYTKVVADAFSQIYDDGAFLEFYENNLENFGYLHNTAYHRFMRFFNELIAPSAPLYTIKASACSIEHAVDTYLRMNLPLDKKTSKYTAIQKIIRNFWPNVTAIKNMRNREEDVNRKVLLLLYVVTEGIDDTASDDYLWLEDMTPVELLEEHTWRISLMLNECGMGSLDPRNPFDWLILYSLKTGDDIKGMSGRLQEALEILFPSQDSE